jgi:DNA-binding CsgD family transcriptional regulator
MKTETENQIVLWTLVVSGLFAVADMTSDIIEGAEWKHLSLELAITSLTLVSLFILGRRKRLLDLKIKEQKVLVERAEILKNEAVADALKWREEASTVLNGLSDAIDSQLSRWGLTQAEKEVALLLLKGLSLKEVAEMREVSEKTARAQSFSVYAKSGLSGRAQLSAFFLEDLMVPFAPDQTRSFN